MVSLDQWAGSFGASTQLLGNTGAMLGSLLAAYSSAAFCILSLRYWSGFAKKASAASARTSAGDMGVSFMAKPLTTKGMVRELGH